ncbi:MAG: FkbM family methyltransferase [Flavobacteriales bacterium]|nr:FkbM family methyltransferase [Flavobacteriales bacterium]
MEEFQINLTNKIIDSLNNNYEPPLDPLFIKYPYKPKKQLGQGNFKDKLTVNIAGKYYSAKSAAHYAFKRMLELNKELNYFQYCYQLLNDKLSKSILIELVALRICGESKVKLMIETEKYLGYHKGAIELKDDNNQLKTKFRNLNLSFFDLTRSNFDIKTYNTVVGIATIFFHEQYANYENNIFVEDGDVVIDAGGCWGDTALYFYSKNPSGKVYSFEFIPSNIELFEKNLELNPSHNVQIIKQPLWSENNLDFYFKDDGPASQVATIPENGLDESVKSITIDMLIQQEKLDSLDFIKMDIEGAELEALKGAKNSIIKYKPKLAISLYHNPVDFLEIPAFIKELNLGYKFHLGHAMPNLTETVLFATVH